MVKPRAYRPPLTVEQALVHLQEAHAKYDPDVVNALVKVAGSAAGEKMLR